MIDWERVSPGSLFLMADCRCGMKRRDTGYKREVWVHQRHKKWTFSLTKIRTYRTVHFNRNLEVKFSTWIIAKTCKISFSILPVVQTILSCSFSAYVPPACVSWEARSESTLSIFFAVSRRYRSALPLLIVELVLAWLLQCHESRILAGFRVNSTSHV